MLYHNTYAVLLPQITHKKIAPAHTGTIFIYHFYPTRFWIELWTNVTIPYDKSPTAIPITA